MARTPSPRARTQSRDAAAPAPPPPAPEPHLGADPVALLDRVKAYVGFGERDARLLAEFHREVEPHIREIVEDFYARIEADPGARRVIAGGAAQIERLKGTLRAWLARTLKGPHDAEFALIQSRVGTAHVRVGLEQSYMVTGVHVFREHLDRILVKAHPKRTPRAAAIERAYVRVLDVTLALMLETYHEEHLRRLLQAEQNATFRRLASLGEVAASIAHEIRNPLAGISGAIQVIEQEARPDDPRREILKEILREIVRLDERVNDLLLYARPSPPAREPVRPTELLASTVRLLADDPMFGKVTITTRASRALPPFPLDRGQMQQVIVNLVLNAQQAMNGSGEIRIAARRTPQAGLEISVEDDGPGVPAERAEEIFRPFVTTRTRGTGLGLPISRKIVESHGGTLTVERARSGGARFVILLPPLLQPSPPHPPLR